MINSRGRRRGLTPSSSSSSMVWPAPSRLRPSSSHAAIIHALPMTPNEIPPGPPWLPCRRSTGRTRSAHPPRNLPRFSKHLRVADLPNQRPQLASVSARHPRHPALLFRHPISHPSRQTVFTTTERASALLPSFSFSTPSVIYCLAPWPSKAETAAPVNHCSDAIGNRHESAIIPVASGLSTL